MLEKLLRDDDGAEIAEWVIIVALLVAVGLVVYNQVLLEELSNMISFVGNSIS